MNIFDLLETANCNSPEKPAITFKGETYTWGEVYKRTLQLAGTLNDLGVFAGDRVAYCSTNSNKYIELIYACSAIGAIFVPISYRLSEKEIYDILDDCNPKLYLKDIPDNYYTDKPVVRASNELYAINFTGGTTGKPKGVMLTQQGQYINCVASAAMFNLSENDVTLVAGPLYHGGPQNRTFVVSYLQSHMIIEEKFEPIEFMRTIEKYKVNSITLAPTMLQMLIEHPEFHSFDTSTLERIQYVGSPMPNTLLEKLKNIYTSVAWYDSLGMTETVGTVLNNSLPPSHVAAKIVDGELVVKTPTVMKGYWNNRELTNEVLKDGWYYTGDAVEFVDGKYKLLGRIKEMIITGGVNVYPGEVESVLLKHPGVKEVAVIGSPDEKWVEIIHAFIVGEVSEDVLVKHCKQHIAGFKCPKKFTFLTSLPKTGAGKVDKQSLKLL